MNQIYKRCRPKRKYVRKAKCGNASGICEFNKCRCNYAEDLRKIAQGLKQKVVLASIAE
jgi:hypothetical protein